MTINTEKEANGMVQGMCMKCRKMVDIRDGKENVTKNGMKMLKGKCSACGTTVCKILGKA